MALPPALGKNLEKDHLQSRTRRPPGQDESPSRDSNDWLLRNGVDLPFSSTQCEWVSPVLGFPEAKPTTQMPLSCEQVRFTSFNQGGACGKTKQNPKTCSPSWKFLVLSACLVTQAPALLRAQGRTSRGSGEAARVHDPRSSKPTQTLALGQRQTFLEVWKVALEMVLGQLLSRWSASPCSPLSASRPPFHSSKHTGARGRRGNTPHALGHLYESSPTFYPCSEISFYFLLLSSR